MLLIFQEVKARNPDMQSAAQSHGVLEGVVAPSLLEIAQPRCPPPPAMSLSVVYDTGTLMGFGSF